MTLFICNAFFPLNISFPSFPSLDLLLVRGKRGKLNIKKKNQETENTIEKITDDDTFILEK